ncbi:UDP-N-acetylmuramoyl-tripeptide--D-alanyl-D-alanine ligase [Brevibacillus ginsengisoli]|uniref:UDP-N-acetylmuramoyl-tripeptide--D-alanyl-D- alanine ligase n=1 Tax=Brevibacillus ginsengisoli TaxID=363854 RepID=UPI003CF96879
MKPITFAELAKMSEGILLQGDPSATITSAHFDTRQLEAGSLFVPIVSNRDGHDFIMQAIEQGAAAVLVSNQSKLPTELPSQTGVILVNDTLRAFQKLSAAYRRQFNIPIVAVTGSNGKTSTKDIIAHVLSAKHSVYKTYKNLNNHLGAPYSLLQLDETHESAVLEVGMNHPGEIDLLASLVQPKYSVITTIGDAHLEFFGTREKIALAKAELLPHTDKDGLVLLNGDNEFLHKIRHLYDGEVWFYSVEGRADVWADHFVTDEHGTRFTVHLPDHISFAVTLPLFGKHNVSNSLPAIAIASRLGMSPEEIQAALATVAISAMRFEVSRTDRGTILINDAYNASPSSMVAAIDTFAEILPSHQKILVLGDMFELGENSEELHAEVGDYLNRYRNQFEKVITIGSLTESMHQAFKGNKFHFTSKEEALSALQPYLTKEYAILFKASRGMKLETLLESVKERS